MFILKGRVIAYVVNDDEIMMAVVMMTNDDETKTETKKLIGSTQNCRTTRCSKVFHSGSNTQTC